MESLKRLIERLRGRIAATERWKLWLGGGGSALTLALVLIVFGVLVQTGTNIGPLNSLSETFGGTPSRIDGSGPVQGSAFHIQPRIVTHRIIIPSIDVNAPVVVMGMDDENVPDVPFNADDVAWYNFSPPPGEMGNAVLGGHLNWGGNPGAFTSLKDLHEGDIIRIRSEEGREFAYQVTGTFSIDPTDPDARDILAATEGKETVTLITCGGDWEPDPDDERLGGDYSERVVVKAERIEDPQHRNRSFGF
jgi:LPXTG-site transpeptidase (sortase) family protein